MDLLELEVFSHSNSSVSKSLWKEFALWACFKIGPNFIQKLRHHCHLLWSKTQCVYQHIKVEDKPLQENNIYETFFRIQKTNFILPIKQQRKL